MQVDIDASALEVLAQAWEKAPEIVRQEMYMSVTESDLLMEREIKERTPTGVGAGSGLRGSIGSSEEVLADNVIGMVGTSLLYAVPVELGTRPHFPPYKQLIPWVKERLNVSDEEAPSVAFLVARKISRVGTEGARMFQKGFDATANQVERIMGLGVERITDRMAQA